MDRPPLPVGNKMTQNNIDTQFANARAEIRTLMKYVNPTTTHGGLSIEVLQSIVDTLDAIQDDSLGDHSDSFRRYPLTKDEVAEHVRQQLAKELELMSQTDRLC